MPAAPNLAPDEIRISYRLAKNGFTVKLDKESYPVVFPDEVWQTFPDKLKKTMAENFIFLATQTIPLMAHRSAVRYNMGLPIVKQRFSDPLMHTMAFSTLDHYDQLFPMIKRLMNISYHFKPNHVRNTQHQMHTRERAAITFTFGKDSLLSFAVAEELGMRPTLVYIDEPDIRYQDMLTGEIENMYESEHKVALIRKFATEFGITVHRVNNKLGITRYGDYFNAGEPDLGWASSLSEWALLCMPFLHHFKARYVIFGNEASCSEKFETADNIMVNPVYDQTAEWTQEISMMMGTLIKGMGAMSLLEPLHDLAITRILHYRYPQYAKHQMSCFADSNAAKNSRWCHICSKCARVYALLTANNINPRVVGYKHTMFRRDKKSLYALFGTGENMRPYDRTSIGRDEQLLAFYLTYKNGFKGDLIKLFERHHLQEAKARERELLHKFYTIQESRTIPQSILKRVLPIYQEELHKVYCPQ